MTDVQAPEIQITTYNKDYTLDLEGFVNAKVGFGDPVKEDDKELFETILLCKIFGIKYTTTVGSDKKITDIKMTYYKDLQYKMMYAVGNDGGETQKCLFGIVSNFKAIGRKADDEEDAVNDPYTAGSETKVNIKDLDYADPYFFILAHKNAIEGTNGTPEENILRVHKIVKFDNTHFVAATKDNTTCGLFIGSQPPTNGENDCIFGFLNILINDVGTNVFYMPKNSCCLEGRSKDIIKLPEPTGGYPGYFKVATPFIGVATA